ncbi:glycosyltransferase family 2 protein [Serratia plymuthica]|uniref:glycosyltransferase family 2 protein n=1 Tax=Serratia plymuthica TaxID=82996 RepID=UPI001BAF510C|nr:glycosyltransferase family 2 protein [Serratia plymuthica]QUY49815.1 glycosyltransferase family 2 protein [Serratia plymuthica]
MSYSNRSETCPISIVIPAYNVAEYIVEAIDSLLNQSILPYEIIVVNDGSTDNTLDIVSEHYGDNEAVKVFSQLNQGAGAARNKGIELSSGTYVFCCDPDDVVSPDLFSEFQKRIEEKPQLDLFCFSSIQFYENNTTSPKVRHQKNGWREQGRDVLCEMVSRGDYTSAAWTYILRRSLITDNKLSFIGRVHEDHLYTAKGYLLSKLTYVTEHVGYFQRSRLGSLTKSRKDDEYIFERFNALSAVLDVLNNELPHEKRYEQVKYKYVRNSLLAIANICAENYRLIPSALTAKFKDYSHYSSNGLKDILIFQCPRILVLIRKFFH